MRQLDGLPDCVFCAVRQLTEGEARRWAPQDQGEYVTGVMLRMHVTDLDALLQTRSLLVALWTGSERVDVVSYSTNLMIKIEQADPKVGDRVTVRYLGQQTVQEGRFKGLHYRDFDVTVERGHH